MKPEGVFKGVPEVYSNDVPGFKIGCSPKQTEKINEFLDNIKLGKYKNIFSEYDWEQFINLTIGDLMKIGLKEYLGNRILRNIKRLQKGEQLEKGDMGGGASRRGSRLPQHKTRIKNNRKNRKSIKRRKKKTKHKKKSKRKRR